MSQSTHGQLIREIRPGEPYLCSVAWSPNGDLLAVGGGGDDYSQLSLLTPEGRVIAKLEGHTALVRDLSFSPDGQQLVSASYDGSVCLWDVARAKFIRRFEEHSADVTTVAFSPDGHWVASGSLDRTVCLWNVGTGGPARRLSGHTNVIWTVAFSPDAGRLASASWDGTVRVWDVATGQLLRSLKTDGGWCFGLALDLSGSRLAVGSKGGDVELWNVRNFERIQTLRGHSGVVNAVEFAPNNRLLATASSDNTTVRLWSTVDGRELGVLSGHSHRVHGVAFSPDGTCLVSVTLDGALRIWDLADLLQRESAHDTTDPLLCQADLQLPAAGCEAPQERALALPWVPQLAGIECGCLGMLHADPSEETVPIALSSDPQRLFSVSVDGSLRAWDLMTAQELWQAQGQPGDEWRAVAVDRDGTLLASASNAGDFVVALWEAATGRLLRRLCGHTRAVWFVAISPDKTLLASASTDKTVRLWEIDTGRELRKLEHPNWVNGLSFSSDGHSLATGCRDHRVRLWATHSGELRTTLTGHEGWVQAVAISPNGRLLASASNDHTVRLWDVEKRELLHIFRGHTHTVFDVAFSPCSRWVATAGWDGVCIVFAATTGEERFRYAVPEGGVWRVAWASSGAFLATGNDGGVIRFFDTRPTLAHKTCITHSALNPSALPSPRELPAQSLDLCVS